MKRILVILFLVSVLLTAGTAQISHSESIKYLFQSGNDGYKTFRIPAILTAKDGTLIAFAEGRKNGSSDTGDIDLVMKRSDDNGKTWSGLKIVWDDSTNVCGNPAPVLDRTTGNIYLLSTWNLGTDREPDIIKQTSRDTRRVFVIVSKDNGKTWSEAKEITSSVKLTRWTWYATGPCHGIRVENGIHKGRLIIPCDHIEAVSNKYYSHIIFSDDNGTTWQIGGTTPRDQVNESAIAELANGRLMLNMRNYDRTQKSRRVSLSEDGGSTWSNIYPDTVLVEPICQASLLSAAGSQKGSVRLFFLNPADKNSRRNMTLRMSADEGKNWIANKVLHSGPSAYSDMTMIKDRYLGCLYEAGIKSPYEGIVFQRVPVKELSGRK